MSGHLYLLLLEKPSGRAALGFLVEERRRQSPGSDLAGRMRMRSPNEPSAGTVSNERSRFIT
jgi:hypothetical protein